MWAQPMKHRWFWAIVVASIWGVTVPAQAGDDTALMHPESATEQAPDVFKVVFDTTQGVIVVEVHREWAPLGADRLYNLVKIGFFDDVAFFRVIDGFMAQFGYHGDPAVIDVWKDAAIKDDPVVKSNKRGFVSFATSGANSRTTNLFINTADNTRLDSMGFAPIGQVIEGMKVVDALFSGYGEGAPRGMGPGQGRIRAEGNAYLKASFPKLDYIKSARIED